MLQQALQIKPLHNEWLAVGLLRLLMSLTTPSRPLPPPLAFIFKWDQRETGLNQTWLRLAETGTPGWLAGWRSASPCCQVAATAVGTYGWSCKWLSENWTWKQLNLQMPLKCGWHVLMLSWHNYIEVYRKSVMEGLFHIYMSAGVTHGVMWPLWFKWKWNVMIGLWRRSYKVLFTHCQKEK